ncbi:ExbD/TolR family protein [Halioxenophilus aromaticivorans]|uniref:Biopolymer transporter ExbD n=1 Tax=Halioxenophilus aromaticivorans TaxID=1306992 RepID=A0AAV3TZH9_9ALTE
MNNLLPLSRPKSDDDNLIPLINIVFLLLIFFMVAGQMRAQLPESLSLPTSAVGIKETQDARKIHVNANSAILLDQREVTTQELSQILQQETPQRPVAIYADATITAVKLADLLLTIENSGVDKVTLIVEKTPEANP